MSDITGGASGAALSRTMHDHWGVFLAEGVVLGVLGLAAIVVPPIAGLVATVFLGWLFLIAGLVGLFGTLGARRAPGFGWALLSSLAAIFAGGVLLWHPLQGLVTVTLVLTAFFVVDGVLMIVLGLSHRREPSGGWQWLVVNGVFDLILAGVVIAGLPGTLVWVFGFLVGIDLIFGGVTLIAMALAARGKSRARAA